MPAITPKFKDCTIEISAIGLRELLPYRLLPIVNPFVSFDVGGGERRKTKTCKIPSGSNPNHLEVILTKNFFLFLFQFLCQFFFFHSLACYF